MSFRFEIMAYGETSWSRNGQVFPTREMAEQSAQDLLSRWMAAKEYRIVETDEPPTETAPTIKGPNHRVRL